MRNNAALLLSALLALAPAAPRLSSQAQGTAVFAPYVSRLRIGANGDAIVLSWEDSPDATGPLLVYRHSSPISSETFASALAIGKVPYGQGRFEDRPGPGAEWYYAVVSLDDSGSPYAYFLPFKNATAVGMRPDTGTGTPSDAAAGIAEGRAPEASFVDASAISAVVDADSISIRFEVKPAGHRMVLYRSPDPISSSLAVLSASIVSIVDDSVPEIRDYPIPGIGYYYAIVDENRLREGSVDIKPGANATVSAVKVETGASRIGLPAASPLSRGIPLPYKIIDEAIGSGERLGANIESPALAETGPDVDEAISRILKLLPDQSARMPSIVLVEKYAQDSSSSDDYALSSIVKDRLLKSDWKGSITQLERFLSIKRADPVVRRARLYLGQAYAMEGKYRDALFSFLVAQETYYPETREWIAFCLGEIRAERDS